MITKLKIENVKETISALVEFGRHTLIVGAWGSGKTTIIDGLQVALLGKPMSDLYTGNGNAVVFDALCTGGQKRMAVKAEADNGDMVSRMFAQKNGTGSVAQSIEARINNVAASGVRESEAVVARRWGSAIFDLRVLRDDPDAVKRLVLGRALDAIADLGGLDAAIEHGVMESALGPDWLKNYEEITGSLDGARDAMVKALAKRGIDLAPVLDHTSDNNGTDIVDRICRCIERLAELRKEANRAVALEKKALEAFGQDVAAGDATAEIGTLRKEIAALDAMQNQNIAQLADAKTAQKRRVVIESRLAELRKATEEAGPIKQVAAAIETINNKDIPELQEMDNSTRKLIVENNNHIDRHTELSGRIAEIDKLLDQPEQQPVENALTNDQAVAYRTLATCLCGDCLDRLSKLAALTAVAARQAGKPLVDKSALIAERDMLLKQIASLPPLEKCKANAEAFNTALCALTDSARLAQVSLGSLEDAMKAMKEVDALTAERDAMALVSVDELQTIVDGTDANLSVKRAALETAVAHKTRKETYAQHQKALADAELQASVFDAAERAAKRYYAGVVTVALGPFEERVTALLRKMVDESWTFYVSLDSRGRLVYGVRKPIKGLDTEIMVATPYRALSGAESVFCRNAIGVALLEMTEQHDRILVDEVAEVPVETEGKVANLATVLDALRRNAGTVQCIYCSCHATSAPEGWTVVRRV